MPPRRPPLGAVAAGHPATAEAAVEALRAGGNAFDAAIAAHLAACVAEPVLASLGGGGYLLAAPARRPPVLYDFFVHTPRRRRPAHEVDFHPIVADFGTTTQEFHIGLGAAATPGTVAGLFAIHRDLARLPLARLAEPALALARRGVRLNAFQAYVFDIVGVIYLATPGARAVFAHPRAQPPRLPRRGELLRMPALADTLEALVREGEGLFYRGEIARRIAALSAEAGGHLQAEDLAAYRVVRRTPLTLAYRDARLHTNPPPSCGGALVAGALAHLARTPPAPFGSRAEALRLQAALAAADARRRRHGADAEALLADALAAPQARRGTTHVSIADAEGNLAALTVTNGEGCGHVVPGTGIMLNNMLGEEDLNPGGFHRWPTDRRMGSMMAPSLLARDGTVVAFGSGGSNRIRSALLQFAVNLVDHRMSLAAAVDAPRMHCEGGRIDLEAGYDPEAVAALEGAGALRLWAERNLFFGGVHAVLCDRGRLAAHGDPRRGGVGRIVRARRRR
ncbi:gamma-glutamyltransferase [Inmirania thermothiophila]|uniref:Gamma-glutamyltranspeptidase/glutathione hydrolase n=1 Tax=Inmirania thermothiophila TaxID=1750597 RepID=A0A3N1YAF8_9GAMM|nr:gamma-glutamyltransferase [Inmirania thermothiophila]ROR34612.1 gamma-glutamyltranspeptidase/glutathione hydrolase [Inmirania thermothiophila]